MESPRGVFLAAAPHYRARTLSKRLPKAKSPLNKTRRIARSCEADTLLRQTVDNLRQQGPLIIMIIIIIMTMIMMMIIIMTIMIIIILIIKQ